MVCKEPPIFAAEPVHIIDCQLFINELNNMDYNDFHNNQLAIIQTLVEGTGISWRPVVWFNGEQLDY